MHCVLCFADNTIKVVKIVEMDTTLIVYTDDAGNTGKAFMNGPDCTITHKSRLINKIDFDIAQEDVELFESTKMMNNVDKLVNVICNHIQEICSSERNNFDESYFFDQLSTTLSKRFPTVQSANEWKNRLTNITK